MISLSTRACVPSAIGRASMSSTRSITGATGSLKRSITSRGAAGSTAPSAGIGLDQHGVRLRRGRRAPISAKSRAEPRRSCDTSNCDMRAVHRDTTQCRCAFGRSRRNGAGSL